jgi:hypothetical protein
MIGGAKLDIVGHDNENRRLWRGYKFNCPIVRSSLSHLAIDFTRTNHEAICGFRCWDRVGML